MNSRAKIRSKVKKLLKECDITEPPVNLATIIRHLKITAGKINLPEKKNFDAVISSEDKILVFNGANPYLRRRFSIAHEIGHHVLKHQLMKDLFDPLSQDPTEKEANIFAGELLMPYLWIKKDLQNGLNIEDISLKYKTSKEAVGWRLSNSTALLR